MKKKVVAGLAMLTLSSLSFLFLNAAMAETMKIPPKPETTNNKTLSASPALYPQRGIVISDRQESSNDTALSPDSKDLGFAPTWVFSGGGRG